MQVFSTPGPLSADYFQRAKRVIPGGVNSPVRAFGGVGGTPVFFASGSGARVTDVDGRQYIDYVGSWGPLILGHAHPAVVAKVSATLSKGLSFGAPTPLEVELAETICRVMPTIQEVRMVSTGTEATMTALRLARAYTRRDKIVKFIGCYHGHVDDLLIEAGSGGLTFNTPTSPGIPAAHIQNTLLAAFNDLSAVENIFAQFGSEIAAVIVEPIAANMNLVLPDANFLAGLRALCTKYQALLIFDEVITGFRVALGGAQQHYAICPDLTTLGKIIGGGMPVAAVGGRAEIMQCLSPVGSVYQAGTLSGNPLGMAAGIATLTQLQSPNFYADIEKKTQQLTAGLQSLAQQYDIPFLVQSIGSIFGLFFTEQKSISTLAAVKACHLAHFKQFFHGLLQRGIYCAPSAFEVGFVSSAHTQQDIEQTLDVVEQVFKHWIH